MAESPNAAEPGFLRIDDPDEPIYRIYPLWFLEEALRLRQLVLVKPELWEDPFETLAYSLAITPMVEGHKQRQIFFDRFLRPTYAQAWSRTHSSDTLLRAYSHVVKDLHSGRNTVPAHEGVLVRSTPRKLLCAVKTWCRTDADKTCFIGAVQYLPHDALLQHVANLVAPRGPRFFSFGRPRAELALLKRADYSHENEVRLIYIEEREELGREQIVRVPFEAASVIEDIAFDPRLSELDRRDRETMLRNLGYGGPITKSTRYIGMFLEIPVPFTREQLDAWFRSEEQRRTEGE